VEEELPEEIIEKILLKMPVKDLIRFSAVCKSWNSLIRNPRFIQTHLKNQTDDDNPELLLLLLGSYQSDDLHRDDPAALFGQYSNLLNPIHNHNKSNPTYHLSYRVVGTCNGLVCLSVFSLRGAPWPIILWNPSIRKVRFLPRPGRPSDGCTSGLGDNYFFGYDSRINDYKVVRIVMETYLDTTVEVEVWSLARGGAWKSLNNNVPVGSALDTYHHAFVNGAIHWVQDYETNQQQEEEEEEEEECIVSIVALDMADESFRNLEIRQTRRECPPRISKYHGDGDQCWLALFEFVSHSSYNLWVMKEYGVAESWTKLFNVCLLSPVEGPCIRPFGFTKSGQVAVKLGDGTLKSYDPKDKQFRDFGNRGYEYYFMDSFVESLVLLDQTNVSSY
jgi:F-box interacting protein